MSNFKEFMIVLEKEKNIDFQDRDKHGHMTLKELPPTQYVWELLYDTHGDLFQLASGVIPLDHPNPKDEARKQILKYLNNLTKWAKEKNIY